jgi:hypothetical protein
VRLLSECSVCRVHTLRAATPTVYTPCVGSSSSCSRDLLDLVKLELVGAWRNVCIGATDALSLLLRVWWG